MICFVCFLRLLPTCWHLGKGENAIHFVSCHQESKNCLSLRVVCIWVNAFASHEVLVKRVHWCIIICNKSTSTSWVVEDTRLCISKIVTFTQSRHEEFSPKTHITIDIFILWIVISSSVLNSWKVFLKIVLLVEMPFIYSKHRSAAGAAHMGIKDLSDFVLPTGCTKTQTTGGNRNGPTMP